MAKVVIYFGAVMVMLFAIMGAMCLFTPFMDQLVSGTMKYVLGAVFFLYATLRAFRLKRQWNHHTKSESDPS